jgi:hypothetical protein
MEIYYQRENNQETYILKNRSILENPIFSKMTNIYVTLDISMDAALNSLSNETLLNSTGCSLTLKIKTTANGAISQFLGGLLLTLWGPRPYIYVHTVKTADAKFLDSLKQGHCIFRFFFYQSVYGLSRYEQQQVRKAYNL